MRELAEPMISSRTAATVDPGCAPTSRMIEARGVQRRYDDGFVALRGVDLHIERGETVALLGPNGAGKTTLVEILAGLRDRTAGAVQVLGVDPARRSGRRRLREHAAIVAQHGGHLRYLTVRETIGMHRAYHREPRTTHELLGLVGLEDAPDRRVRSLSGGQARRLDVAVALAGRPELLFLDEPTTGFDPAARERTWEMLAGLRGTGTTILLTTHDMAEAQRLADRVVVLVAGRVAGTGTPGELAAQLDLGTLVRCTLPARLRDEPLPASLAGADVDGSDGTLSLTTADATATVADLCGWALRHDARLQHLQVLPSNLEAAYMALTRSEAP